MKYTKTIFNRHVIWILCALTMLGFLTLALINRVEREVQVLQKFRSHRVILPKN